MTDWYNILKLIVKEMREMIILWEVRLITYRVKKKKYRRRPLWACFYTIFYEYLTRLGNNFPSLPFVSWLSKSVKKVGEKRETYEAK